jgi:hypothetical protein
MLHIVRCGSALYVFYVVISSLLLSVDVLFDVLSFSYYGFFSPGSFIMSFRLLQ